MIKNVAAAVLGVVAVICIMLGVAGYLLKGEPLWQDKTIELGDTVSDDAAEYIGGTPWTVEHTIVDLGGLNTGKVGDYTVRASNLFAAYEYTIHVRDTVPPQIRAGYSLDTVLAAGRDYDLSVLQAEATDKSGTVFVRYYYDGKEIEGLYFDDIGRPEIVIEATDGNANRSEKKIKLFVDTPPELYGVHEQYIRMGSDGSALDPVFATDDVDGWLTDSVKSDISDVDFRNIGDYVAAYSVTDSYGLTTTAKTTVHVISSEDRVRKHLNDYRMSEEQMEETVEAGFFTYEPLKSPDRKWVTDNCGMTLVNLYRDEADYVSSGSGFIYDITPEYVYVVSVYHVTSAFDQKPTRITFFDGTYTPVVFKSIRLNAGNEASLFRIPVSDVPYHTLVRLRQVAYDEDIYDDIHVGTPLIEYCKNWRAGAREDLIKYVNVISFGLSDIQKRYVDDDEYFAVTRASESGMSGTAIFDERGILSGICSKTMMPLDTEEPRFRDGCDFLLMVDGLPELLERAEGSE